MERLQVPTMATSGPMTMAFSLPAEGIVSIMTTVISKRITPTVTAFPAAVAVEEGSAEVIWAAAMPGVVVMVVAAEVTVAVVGAAIGRG